MTELVTIFGSCRQQIIQKYYQITDIQQLVSYPHYSKEVLQLINYLKYRNLSNEDTRFCFRTNLLNKCSTCIDDDLYKKLHTQFNNTTFFLIEIASRIAYKWKNLYLHHIATESQYNFPAVNEIEIYDLTDEEIEEDLIQIKKELYPKKILVISHFATYSKGKRYDLINSLEKICSKLNIPFLNQSILIEKYGIENTIVNENVLAHFTEYGSECMSNILYDKMKEVNNIDGN